MAQRVACHARRVGCETILETTRPSHPCESKALFRKAADAGAEFPTSDRHGSHFCRNKCANPSGSESVRRIVVVVWACLLANSAFTFTGTIEHNRGRGG